MGCVANKHMALGLLMAPRLTVRGLSYSGG